MEITSTTNLEKMVTESWIECSSCGAKTCEAETDGLSSVKKFDVMVSVARERGWTYRPLHRWSCPDCLAKEPPLPDQRKNFRESEGLSD